MDPIKEKIFNSWKEILMNDEVDVEANFLEAGGTSVNIIQLYGVLEEEYPQVLTIDDIFSNPTVDGLAQIIKDRMDVSEDESRQVDF